MSWTSLRWTRKKRRGNECERTYKTSDEPKEFSWSSERSVMVILHFSLLKFNFLSLLDLSFFLLFHLIVVETFDRCFVCHTVMRLGINLFTSYTQLLMLVVWYILNQINCEHRKTNTIPRSVAFIEKYLYKYFDMKWNMNEKKTDKKPIQNKTRKWNGKAWLRLKHGIYNVIENILHRKRYIVHIGMDSIECKCSTQFNWIRSIKNTDSISARVSHALSLHLSNRRFSCCLSLPIALRLFAPKHIHTHTNTSCVDTHFAILNSVSLSLVNRSQRVFPDLYRSN